MREANLANHGCVVNEACGCIRRDVDALVGLRKQKNSTAQHSTVFSSMHGRTTNVLAVLGCRRHEKADLLSQNGGLEGGVERGGRKGGRGDWVEVPRQPSGTGRLLP